MTASVNTDQQAAIQLRVDLAASLIYLAYRLLGATKQHAWDRAKSDIGTAILDKVVETTGIADPRHAGRGPAEARPKRGRHSTSG